MVFYYAMIYDFSKHLDLVVKDKKVIFYLNVQLRSKSCLYFLNMSKIGFRLVIVNTFHREKLMITF